MKSRTLAAVLALLVFMPVANASAHGGDLRQYAETTWASFAAMTDEKLGPAGRRAQRRRHHQRADVDDEHRRLHVERGRGRAARDHPQEGARRTPDQDRDDARAHGALREHRPVLQLVRPPHGREALDVPGQPALPSVAVVGRQRLAGRRPADRREQRARSCASAPARSTTRWTGASTTGRTSTACSSTTSPSRSTRRAATTRRQRERGSSTTSASPAGSCRRSPITAAGARSRTRATGRGPRPSRSAA